MYRHCVTDPPPALISPLVTATMEHAHGHGSAPDHHETRFITMDHGGGGGPVPVAASPNKPILSTNQLKRSGQLRQRG